MSIRRLLVTFPLVVAMLASVGCAASDQDSPESSDTETVTLRVAASSTPMTDVVLAAAEAIDEKYTVELVETSGYFTPNLILQNGEVDANFIQHRPHMEDFNEGNDGTLAIVAPIYYVVGSYYSREYDSLDELPEGASIIIPDDSNEGRALELLATEGLITLDPDVPEFEARISDIADNPHEFAFTAVELMNLNAAYDEADAIFSLGSFARQIGLFPEADGLANEHDERFAVSLVSREDNLESPEIQALHEAFTSEEVREVLESLDQHLAF